MTTTAPARTASVLEDLTPISLHELTRRAALLTRVDRKYVLAVNELPRIWAGLPADARVLEIDGQRSFAYRSTYLDTPDLAAYRGAATRRRHRWKVRTRRYATGDSYVEVKTRRADATVKERIPWVGDAFDVQARDFVETSLGAAGVTLDAGRLTPALVTTYRRTTLLLPASGARATLDTHLTWSTPDGRSRRALADQVVLETKTGHVASELDRLLWRLGHRPERISKYAVGLALLHPDLPHNRWHRLISSLEPTVTAA